MNVLFNVRLKVLFLFNLSTYIDVIGVQTNKYVQKSLKFFCKHQILHSNIGKLASIELVNGI